MLMMVSKEDAAWQCSQLFPGASCRMRDDWMLQQRRMQRAAAQEVGHGDARAQAQVAKI